MSFKAEAILFLMILALYIMIVAGYVLIAAAGFAFSLYIGVDVLGWAVGTATVLAAIAFVLMARDAFAIRAVELARRLAANERREISCVVANGEDK
jgi:hypothetical protein